MIYRVEIRLDVEANDEVNLNARIDEATSALRERGFDPEVGEVLDEDWRDA